MMDVNLPLFAILFATTGGGVAIGRYATPLKASRQTYCVVRRFARPQGMHVLYESRSPSTSRRWLGLNQADYANIGARLEILQRADVDKYNAAAMSKRLFWEEVQALIDGYLAYQKALPLLRQPNDTGEQVDGATMKQVLARMDALDLKVSQTAEILLQEIRDGETDSLPYVEDLRGYEPPSVMPTMAPTEAIDMALIREHAEQAAHAAGVPALAPSAQEASARVYLNRWVAPVPEKSHEQFVPEKHPTIAPGLPLKRDETERRIVHVTFKPDGSLDQMIEPGRTD